MMPSRCCIHYVKKSGGPRSGHRTGKGQSSFQFPRRVVLKNALTIGQLQSSPILVRLCLKSCVLSFSNMRTKNFQMSKLNLEKAKEPEIKLPTFTGSWIEQGNPRVNIYFCFIDYDKAFDCVYHNKLWETY